LDPQLGDVVVQGGKHFWEMHRLAGLLDRHFRAREDVYVAGDMKMLWGIPDLAEPSPDVAVIFGVRDKQADRDSFDCVQEGTRPSLVIEVVSSRYAEVRRNDYEHKVGIYERAEIPEYILLDPPGPKTDQRYVLTGYRLGADRKYRPIEPDSRGFLLSETTKLLFRVVEDGLDVEVVDAVTGERLLDSPEVEEAWKAEIAARRAAEERASQAEERATAAEAELARLRAELERSRRD
ncbi:MAG TPA: Uma2 family endonuclease, partial [Thermoanaerobaculia bacterium]